MADKSHIELLLNFDNNNIEKNFGKQKKAWIVSKHWAFISSQRPFTSGFSRIIGNQGISLKCPPSSRIFSWPSEGVILMTISGCMDLLPRLDFTFVADKKWFSKTKASQCRFLSSALVELSTIKYSTSSLPSPPPPPVK